MDKRYLSEGQTAAFARALRAAERSPNTRSSVNTCGMYVNLPHGQAGER